MNSDLQAIMARRRQLAEGGASGDSKKEDNKAANPASTAAAAAGGGSAVHKTSSGMDLQAIMARRRALADAAAAEGEDASATKPAAAPTTARQSSHRGSMMETSLSDLHTSGSELPLSSPNTSASQLDHHTTTSGDSLQAIMARRRQLADGGTNNDTATPTAASAAAQQFSSKNSSPVSPPQRTASSSSVATSPAYMPVRHSSVTVATTPGFGPPSATSSPVKADLKSFGLSDEVQHALARRRVAAEGGVVPPSPPPPTRGAPTKPRPDTGLSPGDNDDDDDDDVVPVRPKAPPATSSWRLPSSSSASAVPRGSERGSSHSRTTGGAVAAAAAVPASGLLGHDSDDPTTSSDHPDDPEHEATVELEDETESSHQSAFQQQQQQQQPTVAKTSMLQQRRRDSSSSSPSSDEENYATAKLPPGSPPPPTFASDVLPVPSNSQRSQRSSGPVDLDDEDVAGNTTSSGDERKPPPGVTSTGHRVPVDLDESAADTSDDVGGIRVPPSTSDAGSPLERRKKSLAKISAVSDDASSVDGSLDASTVSGNSKGSKTRSGGRRSSSTTTKDNTSLNALRRKSAHAATSSSEDDDASRMSGSVSGRRRSSRRKVAAAAAAAAAATDDTSRSQRASRRSSFSGDEGLAPASKGGDSSSRRSQRESVRAAAAADSDDSAKVRQPQAPVRGAGRRPKSEVSRDRVAKAADDAVTPGWGDFSGEFAPAPPPAARATETSAAMVADFSSGNDAFGSTDGGGLEDAFGGFSTDFGGDKFGDSTFTAKAAPTISKGFSADAAFGFDAGFDAAPDFGAVAPTAKSGFADTTFDQSVFSSTKNDPETDTSPWTEVPPLQEEKVELVRTNVMTKAFRCAPVANPLNGNVLYCATTADGVFIKEVDPRRQYCQVASTFVLSTEMQRKLATRYSTSAFEIDSVITITAGLHRAHGQARVRVAAILDVRVLESSSVMRVVAIWQWGYGAQLPISLQSAMTPPSGGDFTNDPLTLQVADNFVFIGGAAPKGPCIFMSRPTVRETWSANFVTGGGRISALSVATDIGREFPCVTVALTDGSMSVWSYKDAANPTTKGSEASKRWLFPMCRLEGYSELAKQDPISLADIGVEAHSSRDVGHCTHFAWLPTYVSKSSTFLLAAAFQNGLALFHVGFPVVLDEKTGTTTPLSEPSSGTSLLSTPAMPPFVAKRWQTKNDQTSSSWVNFGPHADLGLALVLRSTGGYENIVFATLECPSYDNSIGMLSKDKGNVIHFFQNRSVIHENGHFPLHPLQCYSNCGFLCREQNRLVNFHLKEPRTGKRAEQVIGTCPSGLTSTGDVLLVDTISDREGTLHLFTVLHSERVKSDPASSIFGWSRPMKRLWLCRTVPGDTKESGADDGREDQKTSDFGVDVVKGGTHSDIVCEVAHEKLNGLVPTRMTRCQGSSFCAIFFTSSKGQNVASTEPVIAVVDFTGASSKIAVVSGRDLCFWPRMDGNPVRGIILDKRGLSSTLFTWDSGRQELELSNKGTYRPLLGVEPGRSFVHACRIFAVSAAAKIQVLVMGLRQGDGKTCIYASDLVSAESVQGVDWSAAIPNVITGLSCWLGHQEMVLNLIGLEADESGYRNFAVATSARVLILSSSLDISASSDQDLVCTALAPLGSFAVAFMGQEKIRYLSCLDGSFAAGSIGTLALPRYRQRSHLLAAVRPDRLISIDSHCRHRLVEYGQPVNSVLLSTAGTTPGLLLEPLIANAICVGGKESESTSVLRAVVERFGRKVASLTHGDEEGIGSAGAGLSPRVLEMLNRYGLKSAASWLLTGAVKFDRSANSTLLPAWAPASARTRGVRDTDAYFHIISSGDQYMSEYLKDPEQASPAPMPRQSDPASYASVSLARDALRRGNAVDALKMLDMAGSEATEMMALQLALLSGRDKGKDPSKILQAISGYDSKGLSSSRVYAPSASLAAVAMSLRKSRGKGNPGEIKDWLRSLAPSLQRSSASFRPRSRILAPEDVSVLGARTDEDKDGLFAQTCNETKHVWNEGPKREKDKLLMLNRVEDWLGRRRPALLGKEGVSAGRDRGEKTLADILNMDEESFGGKSDLDHENDGWVDGVGEGRSDEANLSAYFRMSEGEDEDSPWRSDGLSDISPFGNRALLIGNSETFSLQPSTSSVDEGEPGKVKSLYDLVFDYDGRNIASCITIPATRGSSLDVGVLHSPDRSNRQRCTIEFWFYLPESAAVTSNEIVLVRRTMGTMADDFTKIALATDKDTVLWEVAANVASNHLELRTCGGSVMSAQNGNVEGKELFQAGKWHHLCLILTSRGMNITTCAATLLLKGIEVASSTVSLNVAGLEDDLGSASTANEVMQKSHLVFGLNHAVGFRMTELRVWACERSEDDVQALMYEYLNAAEAKKKFKVKIKKRTGVTLGKKIGLAALKAAAGGTGTPIKGMLSLAPTRKKAAMTATPKKEEDPIKTDPVTALSSERPGAESDAVAFEATFGTFGAFGESTGIGTPQQPTPIREGKEDADDEAHDEDDEEEEEEEAPGLWDTALPLSQQVRSSAAAALIRGPPATRHFGGNRGGLPDFSGMDRFGVGGIAICGSEKTIIWRDNEDPPALTYPIGASGAIISDQMDDEGSEFLCCFLAKDKRMVVFELQSRTVVVELQMTTKLNFWRFLPPEAGENTLCFLLITPVGGFHWMPLEESPRPHQVWKRGPDLQGKKVVNYEEGGSNGLEGSEILSRVGLIMVTPASGDGMLEAWIIPIAGDSQAVQVSDDVMGACLCQPPFLEDGPFLPLLLTVHQIEDEVFVNVLSVTDPQDGSVALGEVEVTQEIDIGYLDGIEHAPPALAMGTFPEAICCSLANIVVTIIRRKGLVVAYELEDGDMSLIAKEDVGHYVIDAVMRYSAEVGGAEIVILLADDENPKDGRMVSFCFRSAA